jgi:hypothetical protein
LILFCKLEDSAKEARTLFAIGKLASFNRDYATSFAYFLQVGTPYPRVCLAVADRRQQARVIFRRTEETLDDARATYQLGKLAAKGQQFPAAVTYFEEVSSSLGLLLSRARS